MVSLCIRLASKRFLLTASSCLSTTVEGRVSSCLNGFGLARKCLGTQKMFRWFCIFGAILVVGSCSKGCTFVGGMLLGFWVHCVHSLLMDMVHGELAVKRTSLCTSFTIHACLMCWTNMRCEQGAKSKIFLSCLQS